MTLVIWSKERCPRYKQKIIEILFHFILNSFLYRDLFKGTHNEIGTSASDQRRLGANTHRIVIDLLIKLRQNVIDLHCNFCGNKK